MEQKKIKLSILLFGFSAISLQAQEANVASGGDANGGGGTVAYSIGQVTYSTLSDNSTTITQGVQQTYEISTVGVKETEVAISLSVFPNPTADNLTLKIERYNNNKPLYFQLIDNQGKAIKTQELTGGQTNVDMRGLPSATYFIYVTQENQKIESFKIIKN